MKFTPLEKTQLAYGLDYLKIFDGSSKYSDLKETITGTYNKKSVSIAGNQMYVAFETTSKVAKKFMAAILENGNISLVSKESQESQSYFMLTVDGCQYWMNLENRTLSSPYYQQSNTPKTFGCEWLITAPKGNIIALEFHEFNVRQSFDFLRNLFLCEHF